MIEKPNRKKQRKNGKRSSQNPINKSSFTSENPIRILMPDGGVFHLTGTTCPPTHRNASGKKKMTKPTYPNQKIQLLHTS